MSDGVNFNSAVMSTADCMEPILEEDEDGAEDGLGSLHKGLGDDDKLITSNGDADDNDDHVGHNDLKLKPEFDRGEAEAALASLSLATLGSDATGSS